MPLLMSEMARVAISSLKQGDVLELSPGRGPLHVQDTPGCGLATPCTNQSHQKLLSFTSSNPGGSWGLELGALGRAGQGGHPSLNPLPPWHPGMEQLQGSPRGLESCPSPFCSPSLRGFPSCPELCPTSSKAGSLLFEGWQG